MILLGQLKIREHEALHCINVKWYSHGLTWLIMLRSATNCSIIMNKPLCVLTFHRGGQAFLLWLKNKDFPALTKTAALFSNGSAGKQIYRIYIIWKIRILWWEYYLLCLNLCWCSCIFLWSIQSKREILLPRVSFSFLRENMSSITWATNYITAGVIDCDHWNPF